jgi:electron transfer flavoprotein alpha subunit
VRVGVLIKQVPSVESMALGPDGRMQREGRALEINAYCRRAISQGVTLAKSSGGTCTVITLGPPSAEDALREAVAWGADDGILVTDPAFAGSDTLATARALAATIARLEPFDLILCGRNSVDADTGQVGPEVAELLGLPFLAGVKVMSVKSGTVVAHLEHDDGWADAEVDLPAVLSTAERLCPPAKVDPAGRAAVDPARLQRVSAGDLGPGPWGEAGSPTHVGAVRAIVGVRRRQVLSGALSDQVAAAVALLAHAGALGAESGGEDHRIVPDTLERGEKGVMVLVEPGRAGLARQLLGKAAQLAHAVNGIVTAVAMSGTIEPDTAGRWGADHLVALDGARVEEDVARAAGNWAADHQPWAVLAPGTIWGREVAARMAARLGVGLTGDAVDVDIDDDRLLSWKPAFGGQLVAAITSSSAIQMVTIRSGVLPTAAPRPGRPVPVTTHSVAPSGRVRILAAGRDDELDDLGTAATVVGVGAGVDPAEYELLAPLVAVLGAEVAATRKVTDEGWQPRSRQIGLTGRSLTPRLYVAIGLSGKFNHLIGVRGAGMIIAVNNDPDAKVFAAADIGLVGDWHEVVPLLAEAIARHGREDVRTERVSLRIV